MRHRIRTFLLVGWGLLGMVPVALAAEQTPAVSLSGQAATRAEAVSPPMIFAPASVVAASDIPVAISADATDPDAGEVLTITASGAPASLTLSHVPSASPAQATLSGTPGAGDIGAYGILWQVSDGTFTASTTTDLTVNPNQPPAVSAPASVTTAEGEDLNFAATAADPDGEAITSFGASPLPTGATFTPNFLKTSGAFDWSPGAGQAGTYDVTFTAESGNPVRTAGATTTITVLPPDQPAVLTAPATVNGISDLFLSFQVTAADPDGDPIDEMTADGPQANQIPAGSSFAVSPDNTVGTFSWTPNAGQVATWFVNVHAVSGPLGTEVTKTVKIVVAANRAPVATAPAAVSAPEGTPIQFIVTASDPDGEALSSLTASGVPFGATFTSDASHTTGTFDWTPGFSTSGTYLVSFIASNAQTGTATTQIVVENENRAPVADAGGPYSGFAGVPLAFHGSASSDPDGDPLTYAWDFGDGMSGIGATPSHAYAAGGSYLVTLTVTDNGSPALIGTAATTASIVATFEARVFTTSAYKRIRLNSGRPRWCAQFEPEASVAVTDVDAASIVLEYQGSMISAGGFKTTVTGDTDGNGLPEITICFEKEDLRSLFAGLPAGQSTVTVSISGDVITGGRIAGDLEVDVFASGGTLAASISPNPLNPEAVLSFKTAKPGAMRVRLYDVSGRFVRTVAAESNAAAGYHDVRVDGRDASGMRLASGVYFFRIESADGVSVGRFAILK